MNVKNELKLLLRKIGLKQDELYYKTGYHFEDVTTINDYNEIVRLLMNEYYI